MKVIFRVGLALLARQQETLLKLPFEKLVSALKQNPDPGKASADGLLKVALDFKVSKLLEEYKEQYLEEQAAKEAKRQGGGGGGSATPSPAKKGKGGGGGSARK